MTAKTIISVDVMGGDLGPAPLIAGLARALREDDTLHFVLHGDPDAIAKLLGKRRELAARCEIVPAEDVVSMSEKPSRALRNGRKTSLWQSLQSVAKGDAKVALTSGNTGAIVAMSMLALRKAPGVDRPAIAVHWPAANENDFNIVLDMGADIRADSATLVQYAVMGAEYAKLVFNLPSPRVGLLNVGAEDMKGRPELQEARALLDAVVAESDPGFAFVGFVEGNDILGNKADVIVTDGFTGNVAMKAAEGTARHIRGALKDAFRHSFWSRLGSLFALTSLRRLQRKIDPRRVNGGVFLGLNGAVVKSHGGADAVGFCSAVHLAATMARHDFPTLVADQLAKLDMQRLTDASKKKHETGQ